MKKVSIIIPYFTYSQYLEDCLSSIMEQGLTNFETILVCNQKDAEASSIIASCQKEANIRCFYSEPKATVGYNRNIGLSKATGEYIYFLDSDDYLLPNALSLLVSHLEANDLDAVAGIRHFTWYKKAVYETMSWQKNREEDLSINNHDRLGRVLDDAENYKGDPNQKQAIDVLLDMRHGLKNISVLHILMKRSLLTKSELQFCEHFSYYSDIPFVVSLIKEISSFALVKGAMYIKRKHNDPITMPSLEQVVDPDNRFNQFITAYYYACLCATPPIRKILDQKMIYYYCGNFAKKIRRSDNDIWRQERFLMMALVLQNIPTKTIHQFHGYRRRLIKATIQKNLPLAKIIINRFLARKKLKQMIKNKNEIYKYLYRHFFINKPIKDNWIVFETFRGQNYADSPKYIYEYIEKAYPGQYKCIWVLNNRHISIPYSGVRVKRFSVQYAYYLARSKYLLFNVRQPLWFKKREGQVFLQTWHGTPLKKLVFDQEEVTAASPLYKKQFYRQKQEWDYLIAANPFSTNIFRSCFLYDGKILESGYPRNDLLHNKDRNSMAHRIRASLSIPKDKKTILYAPTWRDDEYYGKGQYKFQLQLDLRYMQEKLGNDYVVLIRTHYYIADKLDLDGYQGFVYNLSNYDDITEVYLISDICITDYSSVLFDYINLQRPILFYPYDLAKYRDVLRGFYIDMENDLPGPLLFTTAEIVEALENIDQVQETYHEKYQKFYQTYCGLEDGHASMRVVSQLLEK